MTDGKKKETENFDPKLLQKASDMSEKQLAAFVKAAKGEFACWITLAPRTGIKGASISLI